jgi:hypothetical protein
MRPLLIAVAAATLLAVPAGAGELDPRMLVLRQSDVPGWQLDVDNSGRRSNKDESEGDPELRALFARAGRLSGYEVIYNRGAPEISSRADVVRRPEGAQMLLRWFEKQFRTASRGTLRRTPKGIGAEGWVWTFRVPSLGRSTVVVWRHSRVFAGLWTAGVTGERTLALARSQDRRITLGLR